MSSTYRGQLLTDLFHSESQKGLTLKELGSKVVDFASEIGAEGTPDQPLCSENDFFSFLSPEVSKLTTCQFNTLLGGLESQHDFSTLRYNLTPENIKALADEMMAESKAVNDKIAALEEELTFGNTILPLAISSQEVDSVASSVYFPKSVHPDKAVRDASEEASKSISKFQVEQSMRVDVYSKVKKYSEQKEALEPQQQRLVDRWIRDYERAGLHLDEDKRNRIKEIKTRMSELSITYSRNTAEENTKFLFSKEELDGMPEDFFEGLEKEGDKYICTLKYPVYFPLMDNCKVIATRQKMEKGFSSRCMEENVPILEELVTLRHEKAQILGFPTHATFILDIRMAKDPKSVMDFETELSTKLTPLLESDYDALKALKKDELGDASDDILHPYDLRYYANMRRKKEYSVDEEKIKDFFPLPTVLEGMFDIYQELLSLKFEEIDITDPTKTWHENVKLFRVKEAEGDEKLHGYFYLDLHPREGKYGHAAAFTLRSGCDILRKEPAERQHAVSAMVANFNPPTESRPSLLRHDEVVTLFHEFGHIMHQVCAENAIFDEFAGSSVERDFVEAPSQMLENWCWEKEPLLRMSGHYQTQEKLPDELLDPLIKSKNANAGMLNKRQLLFGIFDQILHSQTDPNTQQLYIEMSEKILGITPTAGTNFCGAFNHLASGYHAQYYGYMWSDVFAADMFYSRFKKEGLFNPETGKSYRKNILANGAIVDADEMLKSFLGREPTMDAFLIDKGLQVDHEGDGAKL